MLLAGGFGEHRGEAALARPAARTAHPVAGAVGVDLHPCPGVDPVGTGWSQSQIRYYVFALLFVMFDVEAVFIFPWAVRLDAMAVFGLVEMAIFIVVLALGLLYAWRKGVLRWI